MARRFYDPQPFSAGQPTSLGESASHHIARVLRMRNGDSLTVFNGEGGEWQARITDISKRSVIITPEAFTAVDRTPTMQVTVALPMIKGERMDYALQKATELGAAAFQLLDMARSEVRLSSERLARKQRHWQQVIISACEQCGMNRIPALHDPTALVPWLAEQQQPLRLLAHPGLATLSTDRRETADSCVLVTGPEGGFTDEELEAAQQAGFTGISLGERVLRAETAPVALLAALQVQASR